MSKLLGWILPVALLVVGAVTASESQDAMVDAAFDSNPFCIDTSLPAQATFGDEVATLRPDSFVCTCPQDKKTNPVGPPAPGTGQLVDACTLWSEWVQAGESLVADTAQAMDAISEDPTKAREIAPNLSDAQPEQSPNDLARSTYGGGARTVEKNFAGVDLPDDPTTPQDVALKGVDINSDPKPGLGSLEKESSSQEGHEETESDDAQSIPGIVETSPGSMLIRDPSRRAPIFQETNPGPSSFVPLAKTTPTSILTVNVEMDPNPSHAVVLVGALLASAVVMYVVTPVAAYLRSSAGSLRSAMRGLALLPLPLLVRIKSHQAIEDPKRRVLYNLIHENPGISTKELCEAAAMSRSAVEHHIIVVARAGLVVSEAIGRGRHYFPAADGLDREQRRACALMRSDRNRSVLHAVEQNPGITLARLVRSCDLHASQAHQVLDNLHGAGLVQRRKDGASVQYHTTSQTAV